MKESGKDLGFDTSDFKGSRFRCLLATHQLRPKVVEFLDTLMRPRAAVDNGASYVPEGFCKPSETTLRETNKFLSDEHRKVVDEVTDWWLAADRKTATIPNWDIATTCKVTGTSKAGLLLVEAKAHSAELGTDSCGATGRNLKSITKAFGDANSGLGEGWLLSVKPRYQLSNRFAWAWKIASLGVPVVLVYLGFLNCHEMPNPFTGHADWERCLLNYARGCVPPRVWTEPIMVNNTPLIPLIRSANVNLTPNVL